MRQTLSISLILLFLFPAALANAGKKVSPEAVTGATTINTTEAKVLFDQGVIFLDVRSNRDWEAGRIPGAKHLELKKVYTQESLAEIASPKDKLVIYCNSTGCMRSSKASAKAVEWGYKKVYYYRLGYPDWQSHGYAIE
jgi:rhodanese-related sulfurtransferase